MNEGDYIDGHGIVYQCCVCKKYRNLQTQQYEAIVDWKMPPDNFVSHGYCPPCSEQFKAELRAYHADTR